MEVTNLVTNSSWWTCHFCSSSLHVVNRRTSTCSYLGYCAHGSFARLGYTSAKRGHLSGTPANRSMPNFFFYTGGNYEGILTFGQFRLVLWRGHTNLTMQYWHSIEDIQHGVDHQTTIVILQEHCQINGRWSSSNSGSWWASYPVFLNFNWFKSIYI